MDQKTPTTQRVTGANEPIWGSDLVAAAVSELDIPYVCLNPGASYRGLHDSIVNFLGNEKPQMIVNLHEEHAVSTAQGWAKVTDKPLAVIVHSNVGLMHATMAIFNAWCDRVPMLILGATGPVDALKRRPFIDWIHTAADQGALIRDYTKWDDQPGSAAAAYESIRRGAQIACTPPYGPVYICLDAAIQEAEVDEWPILNDAGRYHPIAAPGAPAEQVAEAVKLLTAADNPLMIVGNVSVDEKDWARRVELAERLDAKVLCDGNARSGFPSTHPLHVGTPGFNPTGSVRDAHRDADVVLSLGSFDLGGTLRAAWDGGIVEPKVIDCSMEHHLHRGWSMDYGALPPVDVHLSTVPDVAVAALLDALPEKTSKKKYERAANNYAETPNSGPIGVGALCIEYNKAVENRNVTLASTLIGWPPDGLVFEHPLDYLGTAGGGGLGAGPGLTVGAALALREAGDRRICVGIVGDGDYLMGVQSLWTAANQKIPMLIIVGNNRSYFNDELHQERVAKVRGRPVERRWIGQRIDDPPPDLAAMARAQGLEGEGPITDMKDLPAALEKALDRVEAGAAYVLDVVVNPEYVDTSIRDRK